MLRLPKRLITGTLTATPADSAYTSPAVTRTTIASATVNNITGTSRIVTAYITPSGGAAVEVVTVNVPANQPVILAGLIGQNLDVADALTIKADAGAAVTVAVSGYTVVP